MPIRTPRQVQFVNALSCLEREGVLEEIILISAASLRLLGIRVYTYFIDFLSPNSYYFKKAEEVKFSPRYELEPISLGVAGFSMRVGTVQKDLCSFRHLVKPYNIYEEVEFDLGDQTKLIKIRPHSYVRKDCEDAIERLIQGSDEKYWQDLYSHHKQIEAIDLGMRRGNLEPGIQKKLAFEETV